jgi:hypothetical protein
MHIVLLIIIVAVVVAVVVLHNALSSDPEETFKKVPLSFVTDVQEGQPCMLVGELHVLPDEKPVIAPICGREVLFHLTSLKQIDPREERGFRERVEQRRGVETVRLDDGKGSALVRLCSPDNPRGVYLKAPEKEIRGLPMEQVKGFLESEGKTLTDLGEGFPHDCVELPEDYYITQQVIVEGERVVLVGRASREPATAAGEEEQLTISAPKGRMLYLSSDEKTIAELARRSMESRDRDDESAGSGPAGR